MAKTKPTAAYTGLSRITDEPTRTAIKILMDRVSSLEAALGSAQAQLNAQGQRVVNVGTPREPNDAVNLAYLQAVLADTTPQTP